MPHVARYSGQILGFVFVRACSTVAVVLRAIYMRCVVTWFQGPPQRDVGDLAPSRSASSLHLTAHRHCTLVPAQPSPLLLLRPTDGRWQKVLQRAMLSFQPPEAHTKTVRRGLAAPILDGIAPANGAPRQARQLLRAQPPVPIAEKGQVSVRRIIDMAVIWPSPPVIAWRTCRVCRFRHVSFALRRGRRRGRGRGRLGRTPRRVQQRERYFRVEKRHRRQHPIHSARDGGALLGGRGQWPLDLHWQASRCLVLHELFECRRRGWQSIVDGQTGGQGRVLRRMWRSGRGGRYGGGGGCGWYAGRRRRE